MNTASEQISVPKPKDQDLSIEKIPEHYQFTESMDLKHRASMCFMGYLAREDGNFTLNNWWGILV